MATSTPKTMPTNGGVKSNDKGGKTNMQMRKLGRNLAKLANQKRGG